jgi:ubiquinone/menaquinone biosynthesis C-methylase UbiE
MNVKCNGLQSHANAEFGDPAASCAKIKNRHVHFGGFEQRTRSDSRIDASLLSFAHGDGHAMPFEADCFGHLLCYDTLHHMHDYAKVFGEFFRVLRGGGRGIFVEPGANHSTSPETVAFLEVMRHDPT